MKPIKALPGHDDQGAADDTMQNSSKTCLSAVLITLNEEANIERCLRSLRGVDEVVIYDSGSTDGTLSLARDVAKLELPDTHLRIEVGKWFGFGATKKLAVGLAKNDWIFSIDADEVISTELMTELRAMMLLPDQLDPKTGYCVPRKSRYLGAWINHGGWYPDYQLRLFNRKFSNWDQELVHEKVISKNRALLAGELFHYVFRDIEHQVQTNNRYSSLLAKRIFDEGKEFSWFHFLTKPTVKFLECYLFKLGFLDGWPGYVIARNASHSVFMKWAKLREMENNQNHDVENSMIGASVGTVTTAMTRVMKGKK